MKPKPKDITFHYTNEQMVKDLIATIPLSGLVLDAGSGKNKVWFNNIPNNCIGGELIIGKKECEIEDGCDFLTWDIPVDWIIGNPPFHQSWLFMENSCRIARKGFAFLINNTGLNSTFTPRRLQIMKDAGFELQSIKVVADKRWFGRYYFLIFEKKKGFVSWERKTY